MEDKKRYDESLCDWLRAVPGLSKFQQAQMKWCLKAIAGQALTELQKDHAFRLIKQIAKKPDVAKERCELVRVLIETAPVVVKWRRTDEESRVLRAYFNKARQRLRAARAEAAE